MRGYRWGRFQGWATFVIGFITWAPAIWSFPGLVKWLAEIAVGVTLIPLGLGLVYKRRFAFVALYAMLPMFILGFALLKLPRVEVAFAVCWYFIPAVFYYPRRWKEFSHGSGAATQNQPDLLSTRGKQSAHKDKREDSIRIESVPKRQAHTKYLPDLGTYLASKGAQQNTALVYNSWEMDNLAVKGRGDYCTTRIQPLDGDLYCATFDFGDDILGEILARATLETEAAVLSRISNDPESVRHIPISIPINAGVVAVLGNCEQGLHDTFIPLRITEVFGLRRISSYVQESADNDL